MEQYRCDATASGSEIAVVRLDNISRAGQSLYLCEHHMTELVNSGNYPAGWSWVRLGDMSMVRIVQEAEAFVRTLADLEAQPRPVYFERPAEPSFFEAYPPMSQGDYPSLDENGEDNRWLYE
jgi:hypothetical protein